MKWRTNKKETSSELFSSDYFGSIDYGIMLYVILGILQNAFLKFLDEQYFIMIWASCMFVFSTQRTRQRLLHGSETLQRDVEF